MHAYLFCSSTTLVEGLLWRIWTGKIKKQFPSSLPYLFGLTNKAKHNEHEIYDTLGICQSAETYYVNVCFNA